MPGRLSDVFGIRANAFERAVTHYSSSNEGGLEKKKMDLRREHPKILIGNQELDVEIDYYEILEPNTAEIMATLTGLDSSLPAITVNAYGKGQAVYVAVPARFELMYVLLNQLYASLGIEKGPETPDGVVARRLGDHVIYVNTTSSEYRISVSGKFEGLLTNRMVDGDLHLGPYEVEVCQFVS